MAGMRKHGKNRSFTGMQHHDGAQTPGRRLHELLCFAVSAATMSLAADTWTDESGVTWMYSVSDGQAVICGSGSSTEPAIDASTKGAVVIPETLGGCPVTRIGDYAFTGCAGLTGVTIPESVASIGCDAFYDCTSLSEIVIPDSVEKIDTSAFWGCESLEDLTLPQAGVDALSMSFDHKTIARIELSDDVHNICDRAFAGCSALTELTIPNSVTNIGVDAFTGCSALRIVSIPASVEKISLGAFNYCGSLEEILVDEENAFYEIDGGMLLRTADKAVIAVPGSITSATIPRDARKIAWWAFLGCENLESVTIHGGVSEIGNNAFAECASLAKLKISEGVKSIGTGAFYNCPSLTSVELPASIETIGDYAFGKCKNLRLVVMPRIPYGDLVFKNCSSKLVVRYLDEPPAPCRLAVKAVGTKYGTVSGGGDYEPGARVTIKAKANSGYVFAGWFTDKACTKPLSPKGYDNRRPAVKISMPDRKTTIYAKFITTAADKKALRFTTATKNMANTTTKARLNEKFSLKLSIKSASLPTVTATGLPKGLSIDKTTGKITGMPKKAGSYTATVTVKTAGGNKIKTKVKLKVRK